MNTDMARDPIAAFYLGRSRDDKGRWLEDIWKWDDRKLERTHDYIQWLFPLPERSHFNPGAPTLTSLTIEAFRNSDDLRKRLSKSLRIMLRFYGLKSLVDEDGCIEISKGPEFNMRRLEWLTMQNHNFLRLTRILKSLSILGLSNWAYALLACLSEIYLIESSKIGAETFAYWNVAVKQQKN